MLSKKLKTTHNKNLSGSGTLRRRLLRFILVPLLLSLLIAGSISFFAAKKETAEIYDQQLVLLAKVLLSLASQEDADDNAHKITNYDAILGDAGENEFFYRIWIDGKLALTSPNARNFKSAYRSPGFSNHSFGGKVWRVFAFQDEKNKILVEVAGRENLRAEIIQEILLFMFIPLLLVVPVIATLVWFGVVKGLRPISVLSNLIKSRDPYNLSPLTTQEIPNGEMPDEIKPLVDALNSLMLRTKNVLETEKNFADNAAHELQTPLAAIKTQAQVTMRTTDSVEKHQLLEDLVSGVSRASHLVSQLLSLARAQSQQQQQFSQIRLDIVLQKTLAEFQRQMAERNQTVEADIQQDITIAGIEELLFVLFRNLIDNASKYSADGGVVQIELQNIANRVVFRIGNPGSGIPEDRQQRVFEHFYRLPGSAEIGCGLGLALASKICELHRAEIHLENRSEENMTYFNITFATTLA